MVALCSGVRGRDVSDGIREVNCCWKDGSEGKGLVISLAYRWWHSLGREEFGMAGMKWFGGVWA
jgi:hypothetical protein